MDLLNALSQHQHMKLTMTPQLLQAINILQFSSADLVSYVQEQSSQNPFMEVVWDSDVSNRRKTRRSGSLFMKENFNSLLEHAANQAETLETELLSQLRIHGISAQDYKIAQFLAGNLNENGFLSVTIDEASHLMQQSPDEIEAVLKQLQLMEPAGIAARTLQECLQIQIRRDNAADVWALPIVSYYLNDLSSLKLSRIAVGLDITIEQVKQSLSYIRNLNPRPGLPFLSQPKNYMEPDAVIKKTGDQYVITMNEASIPKVSINKYYQRLKDENVNKEAKVFFQQNVHSVQTLIRSLEQRKLTIIRLIEAIVDEQFLFLEKGIQFLKPMNLQKIAERLHLHESTISRSIQNKYIQTPRGIFEFKFFFTNGLSTVQGEVVSTQSIKSKIREMIAGENKSKPLSDQQITNDLGKEGFKISRRTVMKYREAMHILSSRLRN